MSAIEKKIVLLEKTKKGLPALWESGGGMSNTGRSQIIANRDGKEKIATYVKMKGELACGNHALFIVEPGDIIVNAYHHRLDYEITVSRIDDIKKYKNEDYIATCSILTEFRDGEWSDEEVAEKYKNAINAAKQKANIYHDRRMRYGLTKDEAFLSDKTTKILFINVVNKDSENYKLGWYDDYKNSDDYIFIDGNTFDNLTKAKSNDEVVNILRKTKEFSNITNHKHLYAKIIGYGHNELTIKCIISDSNMKGFIFYDKLFD